MGEPLNQGDAPTRPAADRIPIVAGPTAVGKTAASITLAETLSAEIISADSRQIYKEFTIGTASPSQQEIEAVPHHFVKEISIGEPYSAGIFANKVASVIDNIHSRGKNVVVSGGSTLYVHALMEGFADIPEVDARVRAELNQRLQNEGSAVLFNELSTLDPVFAKTLDPTKSQRIIRGLEVWYGTGKMLSSFHAKPTVKSDQFQLFVLFRDRQELYARIDSRVDQMIEEGLVEELRGILNTHPDLEDNAFRTIGYQELLPFLLGSGNDSGGLQQAIDLIKRNSRRYAKRQLTWYKQYPDAIWIDVSTSNAVDVMLETLAQARPID